MALKFGKASFAVIRGLTWGETITVLDDEDNTPVDLTDCELVMQLREAIESPDVIIELSTANGRLVAVDPPAGEIAINVSAAETLAELPINDYLKAKYVYDAILIRPGVPETRDPIVKGKVSVTSLVTRVV